MPPQDVRELVPRVRRAIEGPVPLDSGALTDDQVEALAADCIADIILLTEGTWGHTLSVSELDPDTNFPLHYTVEPELMLPEQSVVATQAAVQYFVFSTKDVKTVERIRNESREWEYQRSPNILRDFLKALIEQRDAAIDAIKALDPPLARYASFLAVRDPLAAARLEPWALEQGRGGPYYWGDGTLALPPAGEPLP